MRAAMRRPAFLSAFRLVAHLEAVSWAGLLLGMLFEYGIPAHHDLGDRLVFLFGSVHGGLVIVYVALAVAVGVGRRWSWTTLGVALAATIPPFATLAFDVWARRTGRYHDRANRSDRAAESAGTAA